MEVGHLANNPLHLQIVVQILIVILLLNLEIHTHKDGQVGHQMGHQMDHQMDHQVDHQMDHQMDHQVDHQVVLQVDHHLFHQIVKQNKITIKHLHRNIKLQIQAHQDLIQLVRLLRTKVMNHQIYRTLINKNLIHLVNILLLLKMITLKELTTQLNLLKQIQ